MLDPDPINADLQPCLPYVSVIFLGRGTLDDLRAGVQLSQPSDLAEFLSGFRHTAPALTGDPAAMERVALEFCEDAAANGLVYVEARFCPHLIVNSSPKQDEATADDILEAVLRGFAQGRADFGVHVEALLCCIRGLPQFDRDILRLCEKYRGRGVVGIDIAGDEGGLKIEDPLMFDKQVSMHIKLI
jgi:adenosine deaminase